MVNIKNLCEDGFSFENSSIDSIAFLSLKMAIKAYFSTYKSISSHGSSFFGDSKESQNQPNRKYIENYSETIVHFQHFFELICKDVLRAEHELLVLNIDYKHELLYQLLQGQQVSAADLENVNTIEFKRTLERLCTLISKQQIDSCYNFFADAEHKQALFELNKIRNKIWHRGSYVMNYQALDLYIGKYILPLVKKVIDLQKYESLSGYWKYDKIAIEIDPIDEIISECSKQVPSFDKLAFLKELGRAAYENPLIYGFKLFDDEIRSRASSIASNELYDSHEKDYRILNCPVCGVDSLVKYEDSEAEYDENGEQCGAWFYIWNLKCYCCSLEFNCSGMKNPSEYGYNLPDFWDVLKY